MDTSGKHDGHAGGHDEHPAFLAHHFETPQQQFATGKLGMWIFLVTEILLFGGLFCAYAVFRANHPQIFQYAAEEFLDKSLGALNTAVLIFSSFTMAWGVRCAQLGKRTGLIVLLGITILCGAVFMCVKYVEYRHKWQEGLLWARKFDPHEQAGHGSSTQPATHSAVQPAAAAASAVAGPADAASQEAAPPALPPDATTPSAPPDKPQSGGQAADGQAADGQAADGQAADGQAANGQPDDDQIVPVSARQAAGGEHEFRTAPRNVGVFFSIYFVMTGLHGLHVLAGMGAIGWVLARSVRGDFSSAYFGPVDYVGLYWHLVDLVWIYLFPLLYLIH